MMNYQTLSVRPLQSVSLPLEVSLTPSMKEPELVRRLRKLLSRLKTLAGNLGVALKSLGKGILESPGQSARKYNEQVTSMDFHYGNPFGIR